jgi:hypothetical protein
MERVLVVALFTLPNPFFWYGIAVVIAALSNIGGEPHAD